MSTIHAFPTKSQAKNKIICQSEKLQSFGFQLIFIQVIVSWIFNRNVLQITTYI